MNALVRRVAAGAGANAFGQGLSIGMQLLALPLFLSHWDTTQYGIWLMLSAVPAYFSMADVGIVTTAGNKMTIAMGREDSTTANRIFQSATVFVLLVCFAILATAAVVLTWLPLPWLNEHALRLTLLLLVMVVMLSIFNGLAEAIFRATGRYGLGTMLGHLIRLAEWIGGMTGLFIEGSFFSVALGMLIARATGVMIVIMISAHTSKGIHWGIRDAHFSEIKAMARPACYFLVFPLSNALSIQGFTLLVGSIFGAASVAVFNSYRTLARATVQLTSVLSHAVGPELSHLYGGSRFTEMTTVFRHSHRVSIALVLLSSLTMGLLASTLLHWWTHGRIPYDSSLMLPMLAYATATGLWHVPRILLMAINSHGVLALVSLCMAVVALPIAWIISQSASLSATIWTLASIEFVTALIAYQLASGALQRHHYKSPIGMYSV